MIITKDYIQRVLNTCPISYYCGHGITVVLDDGDTSYYHFIDRVIHVSFRTILDNLPDEVTSHDEVESLVRTLLYHEVSHAMLTPADLIKKCTSKEYKDVVNICEDQRIETINKNVFYGVDFEGTVKKIVGNSYNDHYDSLSRLFRAVRLGEVTSDTVYVNNYYYYDDPVEACKREIEEISTFMIDDNECGKNSYNLYNKMTDLYNIFFKDDQTDQDQDYDNQSGDSDDSNSGDQNNRQDNNQSQDSQSTESTHKEVKVSQSSDSCNPSDNDNGEVINNSESVSQFDKDRFSKIIDKVINNKAPNHEELKNKITTIVRNYNTSQKRGYSSATNSYSGVFDPRSAGREDYRFFLVKGNNSSRRTFSEIQLNLFIDNSGSFTSNTSIIQSLLLVLRDLEKTIPYFNFTLTTMNRSVKVADLDKNYCFKCEGGNTFNDEGRKVIENVIRKSFGSNKVVKNLVLFDGDCCSFGGSYRNLEVFRRNDTKIISDDENKTYFDGLLMDNVTICKNYTLTLIDEIVKILTNFFR